jgi:hypothetical protein
MNKPAKIKVPTASPDYDADGYGWAMAQGRLLRERQVDAIDWDNVAEEIETMGRSEFDSVESALRVALMHILKWEHQPMLRSRSWAASVTVQLRHFDRRLRKNPGLKSQLNRMLDDAYSDAREDAAAETGLSLSIFPETPPSWEEIRAPREL